MKTLISGAGVGGLTAALCLLQRGHEVVVMEQAFELAEIGAGIQIPPNAMKVFRALGLEEALLAVASKPEALQARMGQSGLELFNIPLDDARWGATYLHIHRADYVDVLSQAVRGYEKAEIRLGAEVVSYTQTANNVEVQLNNSESVTGDVLLAADGLHSVVRQQMLDDDRPTFTGTVAWRTVVPSSRLGADVPAPTACVWMGPGRHCVTYRVRKGELVNFVGVVECVDWPTKASESWSERGTAQHAKDDFENWHPAITRILEEADEIYLWPLYDREPVKTWVDGRVALLGDAAHPMSPFLAQGAAMAVEDAWVVAKMLSESADINDRLQAYQEQRYPRTSKAQADSTSNGQLFHKSTLMQKLVTYGPLWIAGKVAPNLIRARQDHIYGYDVTSV